MEDQLQKTPINGYKEGVDIKAFRQIVTTVSRKYELLIMDLKM